MKKLVPVLIMMFLLGMTVNSHAVKIQVSNDITGAVEEVQGSDGRLNVSARADTREFYISRDDGQVYTFNSEFGAFNGDEVISVKNTSSTKRMYINQIILGAGTAVDWEVFEVTSGTAAGTTVTGKNLNLASSNDADATAFGNAAVTGSLTGDAISHILSSSAVTVRLDYGDSLILGQNDEIAITYESAVSSEVDVTIQAFFE